MATIGTVTYPTDGTWQVEITGLAAGDNVFSVSDGAESAQVTVSVVPPPVEIAASPIPFGLSMPDATIALINSITERLKFPGPLKIWNGTALVDAPWKVFDGSSLS